MAGGRPPIIDDLVLKKLEEAFALGCTDLEACLYAGISHASLYNYQNKNPEFIDRKNMLKEKPVLKARQSVINGMEEDPKLAMDYLKNKRNSEFNTKNTTDLNATVSVSDKLAAMDDPE